MEDVEGGRQQLSSKKSAEQPDAKERSDHRKLRSLHGRHPTHRLLQHRTLEHGVSQQSGLIQHLVTHGLKQLVAVLSIGDDKALFLQSIRRKIHQ